MAALPTNVSYGRVRGRIIRAIADSADADDLPDAVSAVGEVTFTPNVSGLVSYGAEHISIVVDPIVVVLDSSGSFDLKLVATDDADLSPVGWTYAVTFSILGATIPPINIAVPVDSDFWVTDMLPVSSSTGVATARGPRGTGVSSMQIDGTDHLIVFYDDGTSSDAGAVPVGTGGGGGAVSSVNGLTGVVVLDAASIGALPSSYVPSWASISGKPTTFPPSAHSHVVADTTGLQGALDGKAPTIHNHVVEDTTGLQAALDAKAASSHTHTSGSITDFTEAVQDALATFFNATGATFTYDDANNQMVVNVPSGGGGTTDPEIVRDTIGAALIGLGNITVTVNDAADTITISTSATANSTDAALRDRTTHTGTQSLDTTTDSGTRVAMTPAERTKLGGVATGATANATDAQLRDRTTHTGTQSADTVIDGTTNKAYTATEKTKLAGVATGATANATDAQLRDRTTHTGTDSLDSTTDSGTRVAMTPAERTKLGGVATGATANATDAQLRDRSTHTGSQSTSTLTEATVTGRALMAAIDGPAARAITGGLVANTTIPTEPAGSATVGFLGDWTIAYTTTGTSPIPFSINYKPSTTIYRTFWFNENGSVRGGSGKPSDPAARFIGYGTGQTGNTFEIQRYSGAGTGGRTNDFAIGSDGNPRIGPNDVPAFLVVVIAAGASAPPAGTPAGTPVLKLRA